MRAIGLLRAGPGQVLTALEIPVPEVDEDEVLVRVAAVGVGLHDRWFLPANVEYP